MADPEDRRVVVTPARENVLLGDDVRLVVKVRDAGYAPVGNALVEGSVVDPAGDRHSFTLVTDEAGEATLDFTPTRRGAHRVEVSAGTASADRGETVFAVSARDPELVDISPDQTFLGNLASLYGEQGAWRQPGDRSPPLVDDAATRVVGDRHEVQLSTIPLVGLLFGLFASVAWWLRRRAGGRAVGRFTPPCSTGLSRGVMVPVDWDGGCGHRPRGQGNRQDARSPRKQRCRKRLPTRSTGTLVGVALRRRWRCVRRWRLVGDGVRERRQARPPMQEGFANR